MIAILLLAGSSLPASEVVAGAAGESSQTPDHLTQSHEAGPIDPRIERPLIPPPGATEHSGAWMRGPFESIQVNTDAAGNNIVGDAANEPSMVIDPNDPTRIIVGWRHFPSIESNFREAGVSRSLDGGRTWSGVEVLDQGVFRTDPVLDADLDGNFYYYSLLGPRLRSCQMFKSIDGGFTWDGPVPARGGDKNWMIGDRDHGDARVPAVHRGSGILGRAGVPTNRALRA